MTRFTLFMLLLIGTTGYALWRGDRDSRSAAILCLVAVLLTQLLLHPVTQRYATLETGVVAVDVATFIGFTTVALSSKRFWPLWIAGFQLTSLLGHLAKLLDLALLPRAYGVAMIFWSYPILFIVLIGAWRGHKRRLAEERHESASTLA